MKTPGPDHPITIVRGWPSPTARTPCVFRRPNTPPSSTSPGANIRADAFVRSARTSHCPYKGDAGYFDLVVDGARRPDAVWSYEDPYPAVAVIKDHVAFYPDRVDAIETD